SAQLLHLEAFQDVPNLDIVEIGDPGAALKSSTDFVGIVLEALQRAEPRGVNNRGVAHHADLRVALEHPVEHVASGNRSRTLDAKSVAHFRATEVRFLDDGFEEALHRLFNLVGNFVDDGVQADVYTFLLSEVRGFAVRTYAKGDDDGAGGRSKKD